MARRYSYALFLAVVLACIQIPGCGGGSGTKVLTVTTSSLSNGTVGIAYSYSLQASGGSSPYTWSQTSGGPMPPGVTLSSTGMFSGTPTKAGTFGPYVFQVTDASNTTASSPSLSLTIGTNTLTVTTTSLPAGVVGTLYSATLTASGGTPPYTWNETSGGSLPPGLSLTSAGAISGTPTAAGTFGPYVFTVTDSSNTTAVSSSLSITVTGTAAVACLPEGNEGALASGNPYAFLLKGTDGSGNPIVIAGSFTPNGSGGITAATADYNGFTDGPASLQVNLPASSYSFSSAAQGCLSLSFSGLTPADVSAKQAERPSHFVPGVTTHARKMTVASVLGPPVSNVLFSFYLSGTDYHAGRIIESDNTNGKGTNASGFLRAQTPSDFALSALQTAYAFGVDGWTATAQGLLRTSMAGSFTNASGTIAAGYADLNAGGTASGELTGGYGSLNSIDATTGRGTGNYFLTTPSGNLTFDFAFYVLNGSDVILISTNLASGGSTTPLLSGRALASSSSAANPTAVTLNGYYLLASKGLQTLGISIGNIAQIGTMNAVNGGSITTATIYSNYAGSYSSNQYPNSSYTQETASGRVALSGLTNQPPVIYLTAGNTSDDGIVGFLVGTDPQASSGVVVNQTSSTPNYTTASVSGNFASSTEEDLDGSNGAFLGGFSFNGMGGYTVTSQTTGTVPSVPASGSILINTDGSGNLNGGNFALVTNGAVVYAIPNSGDPLLFVLTSGTLP